MRHNKIGWLILTLLVAVIIVQAQESTPAPIEPWVCPEGHEGETLSILNWSTYIAENTIPDFEAACGVTVNYDIVESSEVMHARIQQGNPGYDIIVPSGSTAGLMANEGLLIPLNKELIPNSANLSATLLGLPFDVENTYTLPYQWGTVGIGYNQEKITAEVTSWEDMFTYADKVAWLDDRRAIFGIALNILGYDPNTEVADEIAAARDFLIEKGANVVAVAADDGQVQLERGDVDMVIEYSGDIIDLGYNCECETFKYVIPSEGTNLWVDNMAVPVDAPNPDLAMIFMDYILHPQVGADISNFTAYASPNQLAIDLGLIDAELLSNVSIYPTDEMRENLFFVNDVTPEAQQLYNDAWDELLIFLGN